MKKPGENLLAIIFLSFLLSFFYYQFELNILLLILIYLIISKRLNKAYLLAFMAGLFFDLLSLGNIGFSSVILLLIVFALNFVIQKIQQSNIYLIIVMLLLADLFWQKMVLGHFLPVYSFVLLIICLIAYFFVPQKIKPFYKNKEIYLK